MLAALLVLVMPTSTVLADGKYLPMLQVAQDPSIPAQCALVVHRAGMQTLIVQSEVDAAGTDLGWVIPVPARPEAIEAVAPGILRTLQQTITPAAYSMDHVLRFVPLAVNVLAALVLALSAWLMGGWRTRRGCFLYIVAGHVFVVWGVISLVPTVGHESGGGSPAFASAGERVGSYDVTVLEGATGEAVATWLAEHGFALPASARPVLDDYAREGWCFVAARLTRDEAAAARLTSHPLGIRFPAPQPVYPMRLTGVDARTRLELDLFVLADAKARVDGLSTWWSDILRAEGYEYLGCVVTEFEADTLVGRIGHPEFLQRAWEGAILTRLNGRLQPADMTRDLDIALVPAAPQRARIWSREAALVISAGWAVLVITLLGALTIRRGAGLRGAAWSLALGAACLGAIFWWMPTRPLVEGAAPLMRYRYAPHVAHVLISHLEARGQREAGDLRAEQRSRKRITCSSEGPSPAHLCARLPREILSVVQGYASGFAQSLRANLDRIWTPI